ncbi:MAG: quinol:electron acceptor oxidoreductase subunit ActD, partial [Candidatus Binatia bacterium]
MIYGLMAEFDNPSALVAAAREAHAAGYRQMDAYTPFPVEELNEVLGLERTGMPAIVLIGGITGAVLGYLMQYYVAVID